MAMAMIKEGLEMADEDVDAPAVENVEMVVVADKVATVAVVALAVIMTVAITLATLLTPTLAH